VTKPMLALCLMIGCSVAIAEQSVKTIYGVAPFSCIPTNNPEYVMDCVVSIPKPEVTLTPKTKEKRRVSPTKIPNTNHRTESEERSKDHYQGASSSPKVAI
jgi:hypothetical protein